MDQHKLDKYESGGDEKCNLGRGKTDTSCWEARGTKIYMGLHINSHTYVYHAHIADLRYKICVMSVCFTSYKIEHDRYKLHCHFSDGKIEWYTCIWGLLLFFEILLTLQFILTILFTLLLQDQEWNFQTAKSLLHIFSFTTYLCYTSQKL